MYVFVWGRGEGVARKRTLEKKSEIYERPLTLSLDLLVRIVPRLSRSHHLEIWRHLTGCEVQISEFVGILKNSYDVRNIATNLHKSTRFLRYSRSVSTRSIVVFEK